MNTPKVAAESLPIPSVGALCHFLRDGHGGFVQDMPSRTRAKPEEIWVPALSAWVRADGSTASFDIQRDFRRVFYGRVNRWRLRRAVKRFRQLVDATDRIISMAGRVTEDAS